MSTTALSILLEEPQCLSQNQVAYDLLNYWSVSMNIRSIHDDINNNISSEQSQCTIIDNHMILRLSKQGNLQTLWINIEFWQCKILKHQDEIHQIEKYGIQLNPRDKSTSIHLISNIKEDYKEIKSALYKCCLMNGSIINMGYTFVKKLDEGSQAVINLYSKNKKQQSLFAIKTYKIQEEKQQEFWNQFLFQEIEFLRELKICESVITLERVYEDDNGIHQVMKYAEHGSLKSYLRFGKYFNEAQIKTIMEQLLLTLDLMHHKNILHRDIKSDNILLLDDKNLKVAISDFGLSCRADDNEKLKRACGTPGFIDPAVLKGAKHNQQSDIFGLGCLLFQLVAQRFLFRGATVKSVLQRNRTDDPEPIILRACQQVSFDCQDLLKQMLSVDIKSRPTAEQCLSHSWFKQNNEFLQISLQINRESFLQPRSKRLLNESKYSGNTNNQFSFEAFSDIEKIFSNSSNPKDRLSSQDESNHGVPKRSFSHGRRICYQEILSGDVSSYKNLIDNRKERKLSVQPQVRNIDDENLENGSNAVKNNKSKFYKNKQITFQKNEEKQLQKSHSQKSLEERLPEMSMEQQLFSKNDEFGNDQQHIYEKMMNRGHICNYIKEEELQFHQKNKRKNTHF